MENPNFSFIKKSKKKYSSEIYDICCMVDYTYAKSKKYYRAPVALSRLALEKTMKMSLKIPRSERYRDLKDLNMNYLEKLDSKNTTPFEKKLRFIREWGNDAIHDNKDVTQDIANKILPLLQYVLDEILGTNEIIEENKNYKFPKMDDEWVIGFNKNNDNFEKFIEEFVDFKSYTYKFDQLETIIRDLDKKISDENKLKKDITILHDKIKENEDLTGELDELRNKINSMKQDIPNIEDIQIDIENINQLMENISDYTDVKSKVKELLYFKEDYSFLMSDVELIKDKYDDIESLKKNIDELNSNIDFNQINNLTNKIEELEKSINNNDLDEIKEKLEELNNLKGSYEDIQKITDNIQNLKDDISYITEDKLSREQFKAVRSRANKLLINAGPGAGKTRVLVERVKYLLNERNVEPKSVLVITFTDKAAKEIEYRLNNDNEISYEKIDQIYIGTIHSFCRTFLRRYVSSGIEVIDNEDSDKKVLFIKKNLNRLFTDKYTNFTDLELKKVAERFDEFATFDIDPQCLENYILKKYFRRGDRKNDDKYCKFIDKSLEKTETFPRLEIEEKHTYKKRLFAHNFLAISRAYDSYKELFDERKSYNFNLLQSKTKDSLKEDESLRKKVDYKNILIDEFQDTDRMQFEIFEMLAEYSDSVTYVGDINQSIYRWRGSNLRNFEKLIDEQETNGFEVINLLTNYRSPQNIVEFNNKFMTNKLELNASNSTNGDLYYLNSRDKGEQAKKIVEIIKYLKETDRIENYSDIGLLFRSTTTFQIESLLNELNANDIDYHIKGFSDFKEYPEVQSMILLLWYLSKSMIKDETFNLKAFKDLNNAMFKLSDETLDVLENYDGSPQEFSQMNLNQLKELNINNNNDLEFFDELNQLKKHFWNDNNPNDDDKLDLLNLYYDLFKITGYVVDTFENMDEDEIDSNKELLNLAFISNKINDFMETYDRYDLDSFFEFIFNYYTQYSSPTNNMSSEDAVQISTIHAAKGLEFPVVFICSIIQGGFPRRKPFDTELENYPIPDTFKYPEILEELKSQGKGTTLHYRKKLIEEFRAEERRVLYVGLTRAKSTLIVSHILNKAKQESKEFKIMKESNPDFKELTFDDFNQLKKVKPNKEIEDDLELSFTSLAYYDKCPRLYNLIQNYNFVNPQNIGMRVGSILHAVLEKINKEIIHNNGKISDEFIDNVIKEAIESNPDLEDNDRFIELLDAVKDYCEEIDIQLIEETTDSNQSSESRSNNDEFFNFEEYGDGIKRKVKESEYPFTIPWHESKLRGTIDLILEEENGSIDLVDFKISDEEYLGEYLEDYYNQLHFYFMAMKENSTYKNNTENTKLKIYSLTDKEYLPVDLEEERVKKLEDNAREVSKKINNKKYETNEKYCDACLLRSLCCK